MGPWTKFDDSQQLRTEIEERTKNGETCTQIADALAAKGFSVSNKTISRRRVEWGLRKRASPKTKGTTRPPRPPPANAPTPPPRAAASRGGSAHKAEIGDRTKRGESAQEICDALVAKGVILKKGASSILRLQTLWGMIPYDPDRAFGRGKYRKKKVSTGRPRGRPRTQNKSPAPTATGPQYYPTNCRFGPANNDGQPRDGQTDGTAEQNAIDLDDIEPPSPAGSPGQQDELHDFRPSFSTPGRSPFAINTDAVALATDMVTAQMMLDASNDTVTAATQLKDILNRLQSGGETPTQPMLTALALAKRKLLNAARAVGALTDGPFTEPGVPG